MGRVETLWGGQAYTRPGNLFCKTNQRAARSHCLVTGQQKTVRLIQTDKCSNNACRGYVIKAMESCGYKSKNIREVLIELYEVFDFCSVEDVAAYYEHWQP